MARPPLVDLDPATSVGPATAAETHISVVLFAGSRVYKLCKPVDFGFVDYSTRERRRDACRRELEVNRRFAPDVYLGVVDLVDEDGTPHDHALVMRRLPRDRCLAALLGRGGAEDRLREVARRVAAFHAAAPRGPVIDAAATAAEVSRNWEDNFATIEPCAGSLIDAEEFAAVRAMAHRYLDGRNDLFARRIAAGHAVDGHGDLLAEDIFCLEDGPRILDALAFDDRLRYGDVLNDLAFLVMDIERRADPDLARRLVAWYREFAGENHPASLAHFYVAYRANVRTKVACLRAAQGDPDAPARAARDHRLCHEHLGRATIRVALVGGSPGTGKSTVADRLAEVTGWTVLRSDEVRKEVLGLPRSADATAGYGEGIYRPELVGVAYRELIARAARLLALGESVILDASWSSAAWRDAARRMAQANHAVLHEICCDVPAPMAEHRVAERRARGPNVSDATVEVTRVMRERFEAWPEALTVVTDRPVDSSLGEILAAVTR
jgi:hypothetical protein